MVWRGQGYKFDLHQQHSKIRTIKIYNYATTEVPITIKNLFWLYDVLKHITNKKYLNLFLNLKFINQLNIFGISGLTKLVLIL